MPVRDFRAAVIFHGNGVYDGTECTEAVAMLVGLSRLGADVQVFAPDRPQAHVVNHMTGEEQKQERNVLQESARIARGAVKPLAELDASDYDALLIPGGFGAAKNLSSFGFKGAEMEVENDVVDVLRDFKSKDRVIGLTCIAPIIAAKVFGNEGIKLTLGGSGENFPYAGSIDAAKSFGAQIEEMDVSGICIDWKNNLITTPAYMQGDASPHAIYDGMESFLRRVNSVVMQQEVVKKNSTATAKATEEALNSASCDELLMKLINQSVNNIWNDYDSSRDGYLTLEESHDFIRDSFGNTKQKNFSEADIEDIFRKIDVDGDGKINKSEMALFLLSLTKI